jgi:hypothetical protein
MAKKQDSIAEQYAQVKAELEACKTQNLELTRENERLKQGQVNAPVSTATTVKSTSGQDLQTGLTKRDFETAFESVRTQLEPKLNGVLQQYQVFLKVLPELKTIFQSIEGKVSESTQLSNTLVDLCSQGFGSDKPQLSFPTIPPQDGKWKTLIFRSLPHFFISRARQCKFLQRYTVLCLWLVVFVLGFTLLYVSNENMYLRQCTLLQLRENDRLHAEYQGLQTDHDKYIILSRMVRKDKAWVHRVNYIEYLFEHPQQNRETIDRLMGFEDKNE